MTVRKMMVAVLVLAIVFWLISPLSRFRSHTHLLTDPNFRWAISSERCWRNHFWPQYWRRLLGRPWPGDYVCPDHPDEPYFEAFEW
jgi:hypothetical protein